MRALLRRLSARLFPPPLPLRLRDVRAFRMIPAIFTSLVAALFGLGFYYLTLGLLTPTASNAFPVFTTFPGFGWERRFDFAQFFGTLLVPPTPSPLTWKLGFAAWGSTLTVLGLVFAAGLSWAVAPSSGGKGLVYGGALGAAFLLVVTLASGFHPAVMRDALPDPGFLLLGWSGWATLQMLLTFLVYGFVLGALYRVVTPRVTRAGKFR